MLCKGDSRQFWKIVNQGNQKSDCKVELSNMFEYFKNVATEPDNVNTEVNTEPYSHEQGDELLNSEITDNEIINAVKKLKRNKAPGPDSVLNEHIITTLPIMLPVYTKLFNVIFDRGIVPEEWTIGIINPIYKHKGDPTLPENYRPITILSCLGKLFTSIINSRLSKFAEENKLITESQVGFRAGYSTTDNIFVLHVLTNIMMHMKKKLFCAFIDFKQAFDTVWRTGLWGKILSSKISGKCFNFITRLYKNTKSMVKVNNSLSDVFISRMGVRQGENMSPFLFSLFINDLEDFLLENNITGLESVSKSLEEKLFTYVKMLVLLYADDTVLMAEKADGLQSALDQFLIYCNTWKLTVNIQKTKIMIFSKGRLPNVNFHYNREQIEIVNEFKYLGINFGRSGSFNKAKQYLCEQATKAMYSVIRKTRQLQLSIPLQLELFDKLVTPILLYGSEVWGYERLDLIERLQLKFLKLILNVRKSTPTYMILGELGRFPLNVSIKTRIINYWANIICGKKSKLSYTIYMYLRDSFDNNTYIHPWIACVKKILDDCGFSWVWHSCNIREGPQSFPNPKWLKLSINNKLKDLYIQEWNSTVFSSTMGINHRIFKTDFKLENYLSILPYNLRLKLTKFRLQSNHLPIVTGRWENIPREHRICKLCNSNSVGDEYHYLFNCASLNNARTKYIPKKYITRPNCYKYAELMQNKKKQVLKNLCKFINEIYITVCPPT